MIAKIQIKLINPTINALHTCTNITVFNCFYVKSASAPVCRFNKQVKIQLIFCMKHSFYG